jgi:hypothetical protein
MNRQTRNAQSPLIFFAILIVLSFACSGIPLTMDSNSPACHSVVSTQHIGFNFLEQVPSSPKGDISARHHLFLHEYSMPSNGFVTGIIFCNDSDMAVETFDLLLLRPNDDGWQVIHRINLSDDTSPAQTGTTVVDLPSPWAVQKNDVFAHWQNNPNGAIPLNIDNGLVDGFSVGQSDFQSSDVEVGQQIGIDGFNGQRDYFINVMFSTNP